jgi:glycosyltransferase involved in cell wall biosynthesis
VRGPIKILHLPVAFLPWTTGGREIYSYALARELKELGVQNYVGIHQDPVRLEPLGVHDIDGLPVYVLPQIPGLFDRNAKYKRTFESLPGFDELLDNIRPNVVHLHDMGGGSSYSHLEAIKRRGIKSILTYHTPGQSCSQGELRFCGNTICDGFLDVNRCTECRLTTAGIPAAGSRIISRIPFPAKALIERDDRWSRLVSARTKTNMFIGSFRQFIAGVDLVHVHARWVQQLMKVNQVPDEKVVYAATGGTFRPIAPQLKSYAPGQVIDFVFLGRCEYIKGIQVLIRAVKLLPESAPVRVHFWGPYWQDRFGAEMLHLIGNDHRFAEPCLVSHKELPDKFREVDATVAPSIWLETGPLSVLDSLSCGVPVIGSDLGGIREWITSGRNGLLFPYDDHVALAGILTDVVKNPELLNKMKENFGPVRTMQDLAADLLPVYDSLVN